MSNPILTPRHSYMRSLAFVASRRSVVTLGLVLALFVPFLANPYQIFVVNLALINIILAVGLNLLLGYAGQLAFANAALFGVGAYGTGLLRFDAKLPFWAALPLGTIITVVVGLLVVFPALRLRGLYLALATIAFAQFAVWVFVHWDSLTYGNAGFVMSPVDFSVLGISSTTGMYFSSLAATALLVWAAYGIVRSRVGRAFVAIRESEVAAESISIDITRTKFTAYSICAFYAGVAGGLFASLINVVVPESFNLFQAVLQFGMVVVGGTGSIAGSVIGAILIVLIQEGLRGLQERQEIILGSLLLIMLLFFPGGVVAGLRRVLPGWDEPHSRGGNGK